MDSKTDYKFAKLQRSRKRKGEGGREAEAIGHGI